MSSRQPPIASAGPDPAVPFVPLGKVSTAPAIPENAAAVDGDETPTHWASRAAFSIIGISLVICQTAMGFAIHHGWWWLVALLILPVSHLMHGGLIGFHEASHGLLRRNRTLNEVDGVLAGMLSFMSFTLYRVAHQTHHSHLATERDVELWPFVKTDSPRWARRLAAFVELNAGLLFTPFLFGRLFFSRNSIVRNRRVRRRIMGEFALIAAFWGSLVWAVAHWDLWVWFIWLFLVPGIIAGNLQSWRKYIEHVGLSGDTAKSATRSIVADSWSGRLFALTLLHEPLHGVHHLKSGLPHTSYPGLAPLLKPEAEGDLPVFPNYRSALKHLLQNLSDPKVGSHWPSKPREVAAAPVC